MEMWYVGIGPFGETSCSKDFDKCLETCTERWSYNYYKWFILKMTKEQMNLLHTKHTFNIDECEIVWDDYNRAPTQKQLDFKKNLIFVKPLKDI